MLDISFPLMLFTAVLFLGMIWLLNNMLYKPLTKFMSERDELIKKDLQNAQSNSSEIEKLNQQAHAVIAQAKQEAGKIREQIINESKALLSSKVSDKKSELEKEYLTFTNLLLQEKESLKSALSANKALYQNAIKDKISKI